MENISAERRLYISKLIYLWKSTADLFKIILDIQQEMISNFIIIIHIILFHHLR